MVIIQDSNALLLEISASRARNLRSSSFSFQDSLRKDSFDLADDETFGALALLVDFLWDSNDVFDTDPTALGLSML